MVIGFSKETMSLILGSWSLHSTMIWGIIHTPGVSE